MNLVTIELGNETMVSGAFLTPSGVVPVDSVTVKIARRVGASRVASPVIQTVQTTDGEWSVFWTPSISGTYLVRAEGRLGGVLRAARNGRIQVNGTPLD